MPPQRRVRFDAIGEGFNLVGKNWGAWIVALLLTAVLFYVIMGVIGAFFGGAASFTAIAAGGRRGGGPVGTGMMFVMMLVLIVAESVIISFFHAGLIKMALKQVRGEHPQVADLFSAGDVVPNLIGANLITGLAAGIGSYLCVVPGLIIYGLLMLAPALIVDKKMGAIDALKTSWDALKGDLWTATGFVVVLYLLYMVGALLCGVGVLFTGPACLVALTIVYRDFFGEGGYGIEPSINMPLPPQSPNQPPPFPDDDRTIPMR